MLRIEGKAKIITVPVNIRIPIVKIESRLYNCFTTRYLLHNWHPQQKTLEM